MLVVEAIKVINILLGSDDYCATCAKNAVDEFIVKFPEFQELAVMMYNDEFEGLDEISTGGRPDEPYI